MAEPYHRFVFDTEGRRFVGDFESMYQAEDAERFDSWHQEDDHVARRVALAVLGMRRWSTVLDLGCGKGAFAAQLREHADHVLGVDVSPTAVGKARERHPEVEFAVLEAGALGTLDRRFELAVAMEVLSYLEDWRATLRTLAGLADRLWLSLYLPADPIGFVKSFDELRAALREDWQIEREIVIDGDQLCLLAAAGRA